MLIKLIKKIVLFCCISLISQSVIAKDSNPWPTDGWTEKSLEDVGFDPGKFQKLVDYVFSKESGFRSNSLVVIKDGYLVFEDYDYGFSRDSKHVLWSVSKSISSLLFGIGVKQGLISVDDPLSKFLSTDKDMNLRNVLNMSSSIDFRETYESDPTNSDVINILYLGGRKNIVNYTLKRPLLGKPGEIFSYSSGDTSILVGALKNAVDSKGDFSLFPHENLFGPLGIRNYTLEKDKSGNLYGASSFYLRAVDLAKIGYLVINKGQWEEKKLYNDDWAEFIQTPAPAWIRSNPKPDKVAHSAQWWLNKDFPEFGYERPYKNISDKVIMGLGHFGQKLFVFPEENIILVRNGLDKGAFINNETVMDLLIGALK